MSILQEYERIRKDIGEEKYKQIAKFLDAHPQYMLSDVYFKESVWKESEKWIQDNGLKSVSEQNNNDDVFEKDVILKVPGFSYEGEGEPNIIPVRRSRGR